ncbi:MAG: M23 family peptidase [Variovorax sp.]|nr:MAG: M23 family peptidase [Variovorax sp.]
MKHHSLVLRTGAVVLVAAGLLACTTPLPPQPPLPRPVPGVPTPPPQPQATFARPAAGPTIARFNGNTVKGIDIAGRAGEPITASADGRVVIVSDALRAYGTMVIVKHNDTFLTAYAHLQNVLVKEDEVVRQGQTIAEMGSTGTDRVKLRFEIRKDGVAVDPEPYLSGRLR